MGAVRSYRASRKGRFVAGSDSRTSERRVSSRRFEEVLHDATLVDVIVHESLSRFWTRMIGRIVSSLRVSRRTRFLCDNMLTPLILLLLAAGINADDDCKGCVSLDSYSFDKVVPKFKAAVVKFDVAFPYGEKQEEYAKVAAATKDAHDLLVAEVNVKDYGNKDNSDLANRYKIKNEAFPTVLLFLHGKSDPIPFVTDKTTEFTADNIKRFVKTKSGIYLGLPGCIEQLDRLAEEFRSASGQERQGILNKAKVFEETLPEEQRAAAKVYVKTMERILDRGDIFVQTEQTRLEGLLKGKLSTLKKRTMEERRNILHSFTYRDEL